MKCSYAHSIGPAFSEVYPPRPYRQGICRDPRPASPDRCGFLVATVNLVGAGRLCRPFFVAALQGFARSRQVPFRQPVGACCRWREHSKEGTRAMLKNKLRTWTCASALIAGWACVSTIAGCASAGPEQEPDIGETSQSLDLHESPFAPPGAECEVDSDDCGAREYCDAGRGACGSRTGSCEAIPRSCSPKVVPVCGCDGETYRNRCTAAQAGVTVALAGSCLGSLIPPVAGPGTGSGTQLILHGECCGPVLGGCVSECGNPSGCTGLGDCVVVD
jgi:hypothetical protein